MYRSLQELSIRYISIIYGTSNIFSFEQKTLFRQRRNRCWKGYFYAVPRIYTAFKMFSALNNVRYCLLVFVKFLINFYLNLNWHLIVLCNPLPEIFPWGINYSRLMSKTGRSRHRWHSWTGGCCPRYWRWSQRLRRNAVVIAIVPFREVGRRLGYSVISVNRIESLETSTAAV